MHIHMIIYCVKIASYFLISNVLASIMKKENGKEF